MPENFRKSRENFEKLGLFNPENMKDLKNFFWTINLGIKSEVIGKLESCISVYKNVVLNHVYSIQ